MMTFQIFCGIVGKPCINISIVTSFILHMDIKEPEVIKISGLHPQVDDLGTQICFSKTSNSEALDQESYSKPKLEGGRGGQGRERI